MQSKGYDGDEDDKPKTFELIEIYEKGYSIEDYEPVAVLYRDPRVQENGGFKAERGYIVDFLPTAEGDTIILMTNVAKQARLTRKGPNNYEADEDHFVECNLEEIECSAKKRAIRQRRNPRGRRGGGSTSNNA